MNTVVTATVSVTLMGIIFAVMLSVVSKLLAVKTDERAALIRDCLPGANCGACGYSGCDGYADALVNSGAATNMCTPGGDSAAKEISGILGVEAADVLERTAVVLCGGACNDKREKMEYAGIRSCAAAKQLYGGPGACSFGCIGFGDCAEVCPENAICVKDGLAWVDTRRCKGCGLCASVCPNGIIKMNYDECTAAVLCSNIEKGAVVRKKCTKGCIGCTKCVRECPSEAISVSDNLAKIDRSKCTGCGKCAEVCTTKCIALDMYKFSSF